MMTYYENPRELTPDEAAALPLHELATVFPPMNATEEAEPFLADIKANSVSSTAP